MVDLPVSPARAGWLAALVVVPLVLAGVALAWPGVPATAPVGAVQIPAPALPGTAPTASVPTAGPAPSTRETPAAALASLLGATPITFGPDSPVLTGADREVLDRVAALLRDVPSVSVRVSGYCADTPGPTAVTQRLSEQRAAAAADALAAAGVARTRLTTVGRGAADPLATPAASRRVEIQVT